MIGGDFNIVTVSVQSVFVRHCIQLQFWESAIKVGGCVNACMVVNCIKTACIM